MLCLSRYVILCFFAIIIEAVAVENLRIEKIEPTPLFPRPVSGESLKQKVFLDIVNAGESFRAKARITLGAASSPELDLGVIDSGQSQHAVLVPDTADAAKLVVEILASDDSRILARREMSWQPQKKWKIYSVSYSHQDLGYATYPHRLRTENRHANIMRPIQFCRETDDWDEDSRYRYMIETSEPLTSFIAMHDSSVIDEFARRVREGRIGISAFHTTVNTEALSHECLARLFYQSRRYACDLLGAPASRTAMEDDVIGMTWPLSTYCAEAGVTYLFHGHNTCGRLEELEDAGFAYWQGPTGRTEHRVLVHSTKYGGNAINTPKITTQSDAFAGAVKVSGWKGDPLEGVVVKLINNHLADGWAYDAILSQDGHDFTLTTMERATMARAWNAKFSYPRLIPATMDMFFDDIACQVEPGQFKSFAKDGNNQWADQDATDAWLQGRARRLGEFLPTAEKLATVASALTPGGYPWEDLFQSYHRLLVYHEHTDGAAFWCGGSDKARHYETEQVEHREMVDDARHFAARAHDDAMARLLGAIATSHDRTLVVVNPLNRTRTDWVRVEAGLLLDGETLADPVSGEALMAQRLPDGAQLFLTADVPSLGYKTYEVRPAGAVSAPARDAGGDTDVALSGKPVLENRFYRIEFNPQTGAIVSMLDKELKVELVDKGAPHQFNEYLYEQFETANPRTATATWYRVQSAILAVSRGPLARTMTITATAKGVEKLVQTVTIPEDIKRIDFTMEIDKSPSRRLLSDYKADNAMGKESAYVAMPLAIPGFRIQHELPGAVAEPIRQQFKGTTAAYYAIRHFTDLSNDRYGVTISPVDPALVEYGYPRSCPLFRGMGGEKAYDKTLEYPANSRVYLYLLNNMFTTNIRIDQRGPVTFAWSLRSHEGDWKSGKADEFGWDTHNPLLAGVIGRKQAGRLPAGRHSFVTVDQPNVVCTTIKPAEINGAGFILRFVETQGRATSVKVAAPFAGPLASAVETDLVENDRPIPVAVGQGDTFCFELAPFGVKTIRILGAPAKTLGKVQGLRGQALSDRQVQLQWTGQPAASRYHVHRGLTADFKPTLLNLVARPAVPEYVDQPRLHTGGWINNRVEPQTTYYYRIIAVDGGNQAGQHSEAVAVTTLASTVKDMTPLPVEGLKAILVSPLSDDHLVNLLWRTSCESDVTLYEIHRAERQGFTPGAETLITTHVDKKKGAYDHLMWADSQVDRGKTYYYRVCAVDGSGQKGPFSGEAAVVTKAVVKP